MQAPDDVKRLVDRFDANRAQYRSSAYNEAQLRVEFLNPLFGALGWDVENRQGFAEQYKEVISEDSITVGGATKAPDYCFRIGGTRKFFVEAKKPAVDITSDPIPAFQLRRYAWSAKLPLSILSDFEELSVYDCRIKPSKHDKASTGRVQLLTYPDYITKWDEIASVFSRESILRGSFDKYAETAKGKKGTATVDDAFLEEIEAWRDELARMIALRNPKLTQHELNFAVQCTIDRIIFLRICEDRGIEPYGQLQALVNGERTYKRLVEHFYRADEKYNSGLFHFAKEKERPEQPDELTLKLQIDDSVLQDIIGRLYYPDCPYEFSVLPADILGQVYEQFLGKVIRLTKGHQAKVEDKPEVKKAGGVYYTPTYIVEYIVKNTLGKLLAEEGMTPKQAAKLRVLDPACGSGSFLIVAYQTLLDWHHDWYVKDGVEKHSTGKNTVIFQTQGGEWRLTTAERKRLLLNNIYGVDIDSQAVEVTKLSLLLKVLEGESEQSINQQLKMFHERALPDLGENIKCGNSLIGPDFYGGKQLNFLDDEEKLRINVFDWKSGFKQAAVEGGFDVVIGNPPWGSLISQEEKEYLVTRYANKRGEAESHLFFMERGLSLLGSTGCLGYITPNTWLAVQNSQETRGYLLRDAAFDEICELSKYIFKDAPDIVPILLFLSKRTKANCVVKRSPLTRIDQLNFYNAFNDSEIPQRVWEDSAGSVINLRSSDRVLSILSKCREGSVALSEIGKVLYGIKTGDNNKFVSKRKTERHNCKALKTGELHRYHISWKGYYLWWSKLLAGYRTSEVQVPKIVIQYIRKLSLPRRIVGALDVDGEYYPLNNYSYIVGLRGGHPLHYVLGIVNSTLLNFYFANSFIDYNIKPFYLERLPIRAVDISNRAEMGVRDLLIELVDSMLKSQEGLAKSRTDREKTVIQRQIDATDKQIDQLVYELYGLTEEEIKIVEGTA